MKKLFILLTISVLAGFSALYSNINPAFGSETTTDAMLQYNQGIDFYKIGQYDQAITAFRSAIRLDPNYIDAYYNLGSVLEYLQQYDAALAVFKQIIVRKPEDYDAVYKAAWLSYKIGEIQKAKTYLKIIPPNCARSDDAKELANQLNMALSTSAKPTAQSKATVAQTSGIFKNIPAPTGITADKEGNTYVAQFNTNTIMKLTPDGKKEVYINDPKINGPIGLVLDSAGNMYIANYNKDNVLKVSNYGDVSVLIGNVKKPYYLYLNGNVLFVSCQGSDSVLKYKLP